MKSTANLWYGLAAIIFCFYLLTFSGRFHSIDEMSTFVTTESLAKHGSLAVEQMRWAAGWLPPQNLDGQDGYYYSKKGVGISLLAVPFYALGLLLPGIGLVQTVMLTGLVLTVGSATLLAAILRRLGYSQLVSWAVAAIFAVATPAWHYSRTIFDVPATTFCWLLAFWALLVSPQSPIWAVVAGTALGASVLMKSSNVVGVAVFVILGLGLGIANTRQSKTFLLVPLILFAALVAGLNWLRFGNPLSTGFGADRGEWFIFDYGASLPAYIFSPGKSIFVFAPPLLAALLGLPLFWRHQRKAAFLPIALSIANFLLYGGWFAWWGPWSWGPRFLIPLVPFLLLPLAELLTRPGRLLKIATMLSVIAGVAINGMSVMVDPTDYLATLLRRGIIELATIWSPALWPPMGHLLALYDGTVNVDIAWSLSGLAWVPLLLALMMMVGSGLLWLGARAKMENGGVGSNLGIALLALLIVLIALPRVATTDEDTVLRAISQTITSNAEKNDVVLVDVPPWGPDEYFPFVSQWMNHYKAPLPYTAIIRGETDERLLQRLTQYRRVWLVLPRTPPAPSDAASSTEQWWAQRAAFLDEQWIGQVRVVRYVPVLKGSNTEIKSVAVLGDGIELLSPNIGRTDRLVIVTLAWVARHAPKRDLHVFVQLLGMEGLPVALQDRMPQSGFAPTTTWQANQVVVDRYALTMPVSGGPFRLIVGLYDPHTGTRLLTTEGRDFVYLGDVE